MSIFGSLRPKWKDPDPATRIAGIAKLEDQAQLERIAENDSDEMVRIAAVRKLTDQEVLSRLACGQTTVAVTAIQCLDEPRLLIRAALTATVGLVRELAVEKIDDQATLCRIAASDTDAWVRLKARAKSTSADQARMFIRDTLANLQLERERAQAAEEFRGTLEEICAALLRDRRFKIAGGLEAQVVEFESTPPPSMCAELLAAKRSASGEPDSITVPKFFYHIKIWRIAPDMYGGSATETRLSRDEAVWTQAPWPCRGSNGMILVAAANDGSGGLTARPPTEAPKC